jgi:hypothetical protein
MMAKTFHGAYTADLDGDFVVFLIGMRVNKPWAVRRWWPAFAAMRPMIQELEARPELGLLHAQLGWLGGPYVSQYWRSFEQLDAYARDKEHLHLPAWKEYNRIARASNAVGIWHETYQVRRGVRGDLRQHAARGLALAGGHEPVTTKGHSAARRIGATQEDIPAVAYHGD